MRALSLIFALLLTTAFASHARACLNDRDIESDEAQFRSTYLKPSTAAPPGAAHWYLSFAGAAAGAGLATIIAGAIVLKNRKA